jgi:LysR family transcriptional regulator of abg operon
MKLPQLESLVALVDAGSMRGAARILGVTQPTLSGRIAELEREVGAAVVVRNATGTTLTPAGNALLVHARVIGNEVRRAGEAVERITRGGEGTLSIGSSPLATVELLGAVMHEFRQRFPTLHVNIVEGMFQRVAAALRQDLLDLVIAPAPSAKREHKMLHIQELVAYPMYVVSRRGHPRAGTMRLQHLADASWITGNSISERRANVEELFAEHDLPKPTIAIHADSIIQVQTMIASSDLFALLPRPLFEGLPGKPIVALPIADKIRPVRVCLITKASQPLSPAGHALQDLIRARAKIAAQAIAASRTD